MKKINGDDITDDDRDIAVSFRIQNNQIDSSNPRPHTIKGVLGLKESSKTY